MSLDEAIQVFPLGPEADLKAVKRHFRALAKQHHPDKGGSASVFAHINEAYGVISKRIEKGWRLPPIGTAAKPVRIKLYHPHQNRRYTRHRDGGFSYTLDESHDLAPEMNKENTNENRSR